VGELAAQLPARAGAVPGGPLAPEAVRFRRDAQREFRWEAFNAFNTPQWGNPNGTLGNSNFGIISSTRQNNREMQISLKYTF
jgi:hypothetical protein